MKQSFSPRKWLRRSFGRIVEAVEMPSLIDVQKRSYEQFLQRYVESDKRENVGLQAVFKSVFPIVDFAGNAILEFVHYEFEFPKNEIDECQQKDATYSVALKVTLRLVTFETDPDTKNRSVIDVKEQEVYMGDVPLMTDSGTFVINGVERVVVSQMHRSPGVFFEHDKGKTHASGKLLFSARIIPYRGSWLDFELDVKDVVYARIDRRRKFPATVLLYALGMSTEEMFSVFYNQVLFEKKDSSWRVAYNAAHYRGIRLSDDLVDADTGEVALETGKKVTPRVSKKLTENGLKYVLVPHKNIIGKYLSSDIVNNETGEIYAEAGQEIDFQLFEKIIELNIVNVSVLDIDQVNIGGYIRNTLLADKCNNKEQALMEIYRIMRPGEPATIETAEPLFQNLFFDSERYNLSSVGRVKMNMRLNLDCPDDVCVLRKEDVVTVLKVLSDLRDGRGEVDDIDNLGNRRVRSVGELTENQYRIGLLRMERMVRERMNSVDITTAMPQDLVNAKPVVAVVREFFGSSPLSQFMDQTNPLSEITHKRRISALGPGGLTRERAGFEVRDVHPTHYGRICPIETPEGQNIGLINSLATYARINKYGFIESPYRVVQDGVVKNKIVYLSAPEESRYKVAQAGIQLDSSNKIIESLVNCRVGGDFELVLPEEVNFIDVSPKQVVSAAAALIPFLENDDANRALMGSNMQRQAVPLLQSEAPFVGTGMEEIVACDSGAAIVAKRAGVVEKVDSSTIVVRAFDVVDSSQSTIDVYSLQKFQRSNQSTCINQRPLVREGNQIQEKEIIADGPSTDRGDLALGRNVLVGFMPWNGYNFEDSILISERIVKDDVFTSIHIEEFEVMARDTKLGPEEITRDISNIGEERLGNLDESGIVCVGAHVEAGDILVGKVTPKGEVQMTPEEKLLHAIFGEKASDVRDTSLRLPPGSSGIVVDVRIFSRHGVEKDDRALINEREETRRLETMHATEMGIIERDVYGYLKSLLLDQEYLVISKHLATNSSTITSSILKKATREQLWNIVPKSAETQAQIELLKERYHREKENLERKLFNRIEKIQCGDELQQGVMKLVKVFVAVKRKLQPGDKMAGRHGNKGVVSKIIPVEDMPYLADGTPLDIVLSPLGVPSRMNVGQILETHLGWACVNTGKRINELWNSYKQSNNVKHIKEFMMSLYGKNNKAVNALLKDEELFSRSIEFLKEGLRVSTPVFDGAKDEDIVQLLELSGMPTSGQVRLYDGRTGEMFDREVTVGYIYMLKLHHLVDDKIHARSIGPYSLVTQQPLGGKAQFGGQRFGEMEVWALEAYGAAYVLQEILTVKSDDIIGRTKMYESIIRNEHVFEAGIPESFNVLIKEMRSLGLNIELLYPKEEVTH